MDVTPSRIVTLINEVNLKKPSLIAIPGMVILFNEVQPWKTFFPMDVTLSGMVMLVNEAQP